ncbi:uncharacterized protein Bfra_005814 [Botrytis fragariae]|uniref:Uncharacterized protein n=1 Tax=Botrytis fragariae TaxID=1964551 RepID=A0A8H6ART4_9HELO|nr:uncharacterized protein Bfra_005814 [Botrytis fragariae]KAF5872454.1 hypothetical protein Bfra_005814 [Botrytis fragariae]
MTRQNNTKTPIKQTVTRTNRVQIIITITQRENFIPLLDAMTNEAFKCAILYLYYHDTITLETSFP